MTTFEAIGLLDSEGISQIQLAHNSLNLDYDAQAGLSQFYATFDGKTLAVINQIFVLGICQHGFVLKNFRVSFMICNTFSENTSGMANQNQNFKVNATKMQFM